MKKKWNMITSYEFAARSWKNLAVCCLANLLESFISALINIALAFAIASVLIQFI